MNRQEKQLVIDSLKKDFSGNSGSFLVGIKGMTVEELRALRKGIVTHGGHMQVIKNTLMKAAVKDMPGVSDLTPYFKDQVALVFASKEVPAIAKVLCGFSQNNCGTIKAPISQFVRVLNQIAEKQSKNN